MTALARWCWHNMLPHFAPTMQPKLQPIAMRAPRKIGDRTYTYRLIRKGA